MDANETLDQALSQEQFRAGHEIVRLDAHVDESAD